MSGAIYSIYKATNLINNKCYIGFTYDLEERKKRHKNSAFLEKSSAYNTYFSRSIRKYGWNNMGWEIIYQSKDEEYTLNIMENYFITEYISFGVNGYNLTFGGEGTLGRICRQETKDKMSNTRKNNYNDLKEVYEKVGRERKGIFKHSLETIELLSKVATGICRPHKQETKDKMSNKWFITFPDGHEEEIINLNQFCRNNNLDSSTMVKVSKGEFNKHKGFTCIKLD